MTISYHSGGRLQATSTDYNSGAGIPAVSGGWKELARTTLGSAGDTISVASLADKRYYMVLVDKQNSGEASDTFRFNNDSYPPIDLLLMTICGTVIAPVNSFNFSLSHPFSSILISV